MSKMKIAAAAVLLLITLLSGCALGETNKPANTPDINPKAEAANKVTSNVTLYFCYRKQNLLAAETRKIDVPVSKTLEEAVIQALISGPSADRDELGGLFWNGVELVSVSSNEDILFVTLSSEFISTDPSEAALEEGTTPDQKKLAIYSIVNTIVELGKYSQVQIEVARESGSETGGRITRGEAGWEDNPQTYLEPLTRDASLILTPENTLTEALKCFAYKDWTGLYNFTAYTSPDGTVKPDISAFSSALTSNVVGLESYNVTSWNVSYDGKTAVVMLDYSVRTKADDIIKLVSKPVIMVRNNDIWALSYTSLVNILVNVG
ncbi:MAG: GerMN domain-containing protein [Burkholderiales bacterium]